jgi:hypothetical protein
VNASPQKPRLTGRLIATELENVADAVRRLSLKDRERAAEAQAQIADRLERLAAALQSTRNLT